jgi:hypothetical protein
VKRVIKEVKETPINRQEKLLELINRRGIISASDAVGGYDSLRKLMKGYNFLTRENMIKTITDFIEINGSFDLNEIDVEEITLYNDGETLRNMYYLLKDGYEVAVYGLDENGDWDEENQTTEFYGYNTINEDDEYILDTNHLYEIVDGVMEKYEKYYI